MKMSFACALCPAAAGSDIIIFNIVIKPVEP